MPEVAATPAPAAPQAPRRYEIPVFNDEVALAPSGTPAPATPAPAEAPAPVEGQNTGEQAPPAKPEGEKPEEVTPEVAAKREGRRFERRLDKANRARAEALVRAEAAERQLGEERARNVPKAPEGEPKLENFDYDPEKYAAAKAEYAKSQAGKEFEAKQRSETQKQAHQKLVSSWEEKLAAAEDADQEIDPILPQLRPDTPLTFAIMEAENGVEIAQFLIKNPKEDQRIAKLSPLSQAREIGKLEAKLAAEPAKPKAPSKAPAPITPLTGVATTANPEPSEQDDMGQWMKKRQKQVYGKR